MSRVMRTGSPQHDVEMGVVTGNTSQHSPSSHGRLDTTQRTEPTSPSTQSAMSSNPSSATAYDASNAAPTPNQASPTTASTQVKSPPLDPSAPGDWVVDNHRDNVVTALHSVKSGEKSFRVHFAEMQRMHMRKIQVKLIRHGVEMRATNKESPGWEKDLKEYIDAMKDHDYIMEHRDLGNDKFTASGEREIDRWLLNKIAGPEVAKLGDLRKDYCRDPFDRRPYPIGLSRASLAAAAGLITFRKRVVMAFVAAFMLVAPMWLMVLHNTVYTGLVTTTACVAFIGAFLSYVLEKPMDVLSGTAAYAAVLVVFVGLTNSKG